MAGDSLTFAEELILAEERSREFPTESDPQPELIVIERDEFATRESFHIQEPGIEFPIAGPGTLDSVVVVAESDQFDAFLEVDDRTIISDAFGTLQTRATELSRISAYQRSDGNFVFAAEGYEFQKAVDCVISPDSTITFQYQRAEIDVVRGD